MIHSWRRMKTLKSVFFFIVQSGIGFVPVRRDWGRLQRAAGNAFRSRLQCARDKPVDGLHRERQEVRRDARFLIHGRGLDGARSRRIPENGNERAGEDGRGSTGGKDLTGVRLCSYFYVFGTVGGSGIRSPSARIRCRCISIADCIRFLTCCSVCPVAMHPGRSGM